MSEPASAGPRIAPLKPEDFTDDLMTIVTQMADLNASLDSRDQGMLTDALASRAADAAIDQPTAIAALPEIICTMLRHPQLFSRMTAVGVHLLTQGALCARDREMAILRIGWLCRAPYEWGEHVIIAKKAGVSSEEIERITLGSNAAGWSAHERAILSAAEELHRDATISDQTWAALAKTLDDRQLIELPVLIGQYQGVAYYQNALRLRLHEGNLGLAAR